MTDKKPLSSELVSEPFPGSRTPGWNDPPTVDFNTNRVSGRPRLNLSKRVAFPLQSASAKKIDTIITKPTAIVPPNQTLPPLNSTLQPVAIVHPMLDSHIDTIKLPNGALAYSLNILRGQARNIAESMNVCKKEVESRLETIEKLWQANSLSILVQTKIYHLANALSKNDYNAAMGYYNSLVTNHTNECSKWVIALRHVILTMQPEITDNMQENVGMENVSHATSTTN